MIETLDSSVTEAKVGRTPAAVRERALPDAFAPMVRNAWYVIAERKDVGRELRSLKVLGEPLVFYRTEAGEPVVLDDRCAHRRFSLSKGVLSGDTIQCGYHGFTYDQSGGCIWAPTLTVKPRFGVRRYAAAEAGPWLWVWMGHAEEADPAQIPMPVLDATYQWESATGYTYNPGNYMLLIENFLDLTHIHFLHGAAISDIAQANTAPKAVPLPAGSVGWIKETERTPAGLFATVCGGDPALPVRAVSTDTQIGPSVNHGYEDRLALPGEDHPLFPLRFHITHAITPEDENGTHQFFQTSLNRPSVEGIESFRDFTRDVIFVQDVEAIGCMHKAISEDRRVGQVEWGIPGDRFGITMRRALRQMAEAERAI